MWSGGISHSAAAISNAVPQIFILSEVKIFSLKTVFLMDLGNILPTIA